jgi:trimeric autotransporter adhesin
MKTTATLLYHRKPWLLVFGLMAGLFSAAQNIDFGKSYINVTKGLNGGTVEPGDTLEIRSAFVVRSGIYDSCGYFDAVPAGTAYIPGTVRVLTNEGKIYKQFTDAPGDDAGWINSGNVRINLGYNGAAAPANAFRRGRVANTHRPSFYNSSCIMIASFRVRVTAAFGAIISTGGGSMTYRSGAAALQTFVFPANTVAVYQNFGMCANAVGTNALGTEFNGTFGTGRPRNRTASANVPPSYTYATFTSGSPQDYNYGIANNTSINTGYTTLNTWPKPDNTRRVFGVWDIIGDHTGAANPLTGNGAADTVANANGGYMLVINASYRIDSAFQQTISNLCPNTYYEISCWLRNICSRCGCDSAGRGAGSGGYIPTAPGDSSGVYPNLTFEVDGVDYYTTGNIQYTGQWVKKGFTFRTGPAQTSFVLKFFNNAPGGGGNDWALDDITVATCGPNLEFTPSNNPTVCANNTVDLGVYIRSFFNNYTEFKWQKSTDNGSTWTDLGVSGSGTPAVVGSNWEYYTTLPTFVATAADSGTKFRVIVATTSSNLSNANCSFTDVASVLTLNVISCGNPLSTDFISFAGKMNGDKAALQWTVNKEDEPVSYEVEGSEDGLRFNTVTVVAGYANGQDINTYSWTGTQPSSYRFYRIRMRSSTGQKISRTIQLSSAKTEMQLNVVNPFTRELKVDVWMNNDAIGELRLTDNGGRTVLYQKLWLKTGSNAFSFMQAAGLAKGLYYLEIKTDTLQIQRKVVKQ